MVHPTEYFPHGVLPGYLFILTHRPHLFTVTTMLSEGSRGRTEFNPRLEKIVSNTKRMSLERLSLSPKKIFFFFKSFRKNPKISF